VAVLNHLEVESHKHWLLQFFLSSQKALSVEINNQLISSNAIIVNGHTAHSVKSNGEPTFTILIDPLSNTGRVLRELLGDKSFYVFCQEKTNKMQQAFNFALKQNDYDGYLFFTQNIIQDISISEIKKMDERIFRILTLLEDCEHEDEAHQIKYFSKKIGLSESRLAHLFKKEISIPLKSYIVLHKLQKTYENILNGENITTASINAGFDSPSHFAYTNKLMTGMSATNIVKDSEFLKVI